MISWLEKKGSHLFSPIVNEERRIKKWMLLFVDVDLVLFQQIVERGTADFKEFSGPADVVAAQGQGPADAVLELADIARPVMGAEGGDGCR